MISAKYTRTGEILPIKLTWRRRLILRYNGRVHIEDRGPPEFSRATPHFLTHCKIHGYLLDYPHSKDVLRCPECVDNQLRELKRKGLI
jgi:hypothetical protein